MPKLLIEEHRKHPGNHLPFDQESVKSRKAAVLELHEQGFSLHEIAKVTNYTYNSVASVLSNLKKKNRVDPFEKLRPKAIKAIKEIVQGKAIGQSNPPNSSDILKAGTMVLDRTDPIIHQSESRSLNINLGAEDITHIDKALERHYSKQSVDNSIPISVDNQKNAVSD